MSERHNDPPVQMTKRKTSPASPKTKRKTYPASPPNETELRTRLKDGFDRILSKIKQPPSTLDRNALLRCLELCVTWYCHALRYGHKKPLKNQRNSLELIEKTAKRLSNLVSNEILAVMDWPATGARPRDFLAELISAARKALDPLPPPALVIFRGYQAKFRQRSALEWLSGYYLPHVYELFFRREAKPTMDGEYVRFAEIVIYQLQITPRGRSQVGTQETISRALTSVRSDRSRRKLLPDEGAYTKASHHQLWRVDLFLHGGAYALYSGVKPPADLPLWELLNFLEANRKS
jgi:hypothetical protein